MLALPTNLLMRGEDVASCSRTIAPQPGTCTSNEAPGVGTPFAANAVQSPQKALSDGEDAAGHTDEGNDAVSLLGDEDTVDHLLDMAVKAPTVCQAPPLVPTGAGEVLDSQLREVLQELVEANENVGAPLSREVTVLLNKLWTIPLSKEKLKVRLQEAVMLIM